MVWLTACFAWLNYWVIVVFPVGRCSSIDNVLFYRMYPVSSIVHYIPLVVALLSLREVFLSLVFSISSYHRYRTRYLWFCTSSLCYCLPVLLWSNSLSSVFLSRNLVLFQILFSFPALFLLFTFYSYSLLIPCDHILLSHIATLRFLPLISVSFPLYFSITMPFVSLTILSLPPRHFLSLSIILPPCGPASLPSNTPLFLLSAFLITQLSFSFIFFFHTHGPLPPSTKHRSSSLQSCLLFHRFQII